MGLINAMRVLHLAMHDNTGAGRATTRLHNALNNEHINSLLLVSEKNVDNSSVIVPKTQTRLYKKYHLAVINNLLKNNVKQNIFSINITPSLICEYIKIINPDIVNLHWIGWEFLRIEEIKKIKFPIVWTLHDMWAFTGGCHYNQECDRYTNSCGACPQLHSNKNCDLSRWVWQRKAKAWKNLNLTIITPSQWLAKCASSSSLFQNKRVEVIPNGLDTQTYKPINKNLARKILNLPQDKQLILFGAMNATNDQRKGFHLLQLALKDLRQAVWEEQLELVIFGSSQPTNEANLSFKSHYLGRLNDDISLSLVYSAADVMVVPSIQEAFGQTASEAIACGTPVVAFRVTGLQDIVTHQRNGYLAQPFDTRDLAQGITWVLEDSDRYQQLSHRAREKVEQEFTLKLQAKRYLALFNEILENSKL